MEAKPINLLLNTDLKTLVYLYNHSCYHSRSLFHFVPQTLFSTEKKWKNYSLHQPSKFPQRYAYNFFIIKVKYSIVCGKEFIVSFSVSCRTIEWPRENFNFQGLGL